MFWYAVLCCTLSYANIDNHNRSDISLRQYDNTRTSTLISHQIFRIYSITSAIYKVLLFTYTVTGEKRSPHVFHKDTHRYFLSFTTGEK